MIRRLFQRSSLTTKATLVVSGAMAIGFTGLGAALTWHAFSRARASQIVVAQTLADSLALASELALAVGDQAELSRLANGCVLVDGVHRVQFFSVTDDLIAESIAEEAKSNRSSFLGLFPPIQGESGRSEVFLHETSNPEIAHVELSVGRSSSRQRLGMVDVQLCHEPLIAEARKQASIMLALAVASGGFIALLVNASVRRWTRRLDPLVRAAGDISDGDLDTPIQTAGADEIAMLAQALESMRTAIGGRDYELRTINDNLQERVDERTRELNDAKNLAEAASEAKSLFLASMSHEIRTPMTAIMGFAELMAQPQADSDRAECVGTIRRNGEHLLAIINDILDISKIEAGKMEIERVACEPAGVLAEIESLLSVRCQSKGITLSFDLTTPIPGLIQTDPARFRQVLINLVGNAIKYTEQGSVRVSAAFEPIRGGEDGALRIDVADTGIGLTSEQISRLFQPFVQGDASMNRRFGGTGLGLAIARRLALLLGGDISVRSVSGEGSVFSVSISTGDIRGVGSVRSIRVVRGTSRAGENRPRAGSGLRGARILVAEDGPDNQRLIGHLLRGAGVKVEIAPDGAVAKEAALASLHAGSPFDLILMDMQMPVMDGYTATSQLRQAGFKGPILALTAHAMVGDRERCVASGCDDYSTKPIQREALLRACRDLIERHRASQPAAA